MGVDVGVTFPRKFEAELLQRLALWRKLEGALDCTDGHLSVSLPSFLRIDLVSHFRVVNGCKPLRQDVGDLTSWT